MAVLQIRVNDDPVLRQKAKRITAIDDRVRQLAHDMVETMRAANGIGLAAPQVGVLLRLIVVEIPEERDEGQKYQFTVLVNPEIVKATGEQVGPEGCLSLPGLVGDVRRAAKVVVKGLDLRGKEVRVKAQGLFARALQHEIDHLDGILFIDRVEDPSTIQRVSSEERPRAKVASPVS
jgi:peptide deformylase